MTRSQSAKENMGAAKKISIFEDEFLIPLISGSFESTDMCKAVNYWKENEWLRKWLNKYVNTRPKYEVFLGSNGQLTKDEIPELGETTAPLHSSDEDACAISWHSNKKIALIQSNWYTKEDYKGTFGYIVSSIPPDDSIIIDYRHFYGVIKKWYIKNKDIKERWDYKLDENVLQNLYKKARKYFDNNKTDVNNKNQPDNKTRSTIVPMDRGDGDTPDADDWDYKDIGKSLDILIAAGNDILVTREHHQATCIGRWINADGKVMKDGSW